MSAIYEFACKDGHEFSLWSDAARFCPQCGSEYLKRIFKTPPNIGTGKPAKVDQLVRRELEARGITNIQGGGHEGDVEKVSYKSTEAELKADKVMRDFPAMNDKDELKKINQQIIQKWSNIGVKGIIKSGLQHTPGADVTRAAILNAGKNDRFMTNRVIRKDPQNLQLPK